MEYMEFKKIIEEYMRCADEHQQCTLSGDYKKGNKYADTILMYNAFFEKEYEKETTHTIIDAIIESNDPGAVMWIAPVCAKLQYRLPEIKEKIIKYSEDKNLGLSAFGAEMLLKQL